MNPDDTTDTTAVDDAAEAEAAFGSGFAGEDKADTKSPAHGKAEPARDASREEAEPEPEIVKVTAKDWAEVQEKTAHNNAQLAKAWGTMGAMQKLINSLQAKAQVTTEAQPVQRKFEISKEAFAEMEKDFPELAHQTKAALERALSGLPANGASEVDPAKIESLYSQYAAKRELEVLEDAYPDWREITGAIDASRETPDPEHPFRKWLSTKDESYQNRVNNSESAEVIKRAIRTFQRETAASAAPAKPNGTNGAAPRETARRDAIRAAVQPRGDNAGASSGVSEEDAFAAGFSGR